MNTWNDDLRRLMVLLDAAALALCDAHSAQTEASMQLHGARLALQDAQKEWGDLLRQLQKHCECKPLSLSMDPSMQKKIGMHFSAFAGGTAV